MTAIAQPWGWGMIQTPEPRTTYVAECDGEFFGRFNTPQEAVRAARNGQPFFESTVHEESAQGRRRIFRNRVF